MERDKFNAAWNEINELLMGAAGRMIVTAMSGNAEIKKAHKMVLDASNKFDELMEGLEADNG